MLASLVLAVLPLSACSEEDFIFNCGLESERAATEARTALDLVLPRAREVYDLREDFEMGEPRVFLYADRQAYEEVEQELTGGAFKRNLAFAHIKSLTAHVALQPEIGPEALERVGLPAQTLRLLAHEAAHLVRFAHMKNSRNHPGWFSDGAASWIDEKVSLDLGLLSDVETDPNFATNILRVQGLLERGALPSVDDLFHDRTEELEWSERYDVRWMFFRFLLEGEHGERLRTLLAEARRLGGGADFTERLGETAVKVFGKRRYGKLDTEFRAYVSSFEPAWQEIYRCLYRSGEHWVQAAYEKNAIAWRREPSGKATYKVSGELTILPGSGSQMNLLLGRGDEGFFSVAFTAGAGVTLFEYLSEGSRWERRAFAECADVVVGEPFRFEVRVSRSKVRVKIEGESVASARPQELDLSGPWGLGAQSRSTGLWKIDGLDNP